MIVYIDIVAITNLCLNACLLWSVGLIFREKIVWYKILFGAAVGAGYQILCMLLGIRYISLSIAAAFLQILIAYKKRHLFLTIGYISAACVVGGILFLFPQEANGLIFIFLAACIFIIYIARMFEAKIRMGRLKKQVEIGVKERYIRLEGYVDSGNKLKIAVINAQAAEYLLGRDALLCMQELRAGFDYTLVLCRTVSGEGMIPAFRPDYMRIDGVEVNLKVGVAFESVSDEVLLPREFIFKEYCKNV